MSGSLRLLILKIMNSLYLTNTGKGGLRDQLLKGGAGSFAIITFNTILGFVLVILLARLLGAEGYGVYTYVLALLSFISIPAQLGLPNLVIRETAKLRSLSDWSYIKGVWRWSSLAAIVFSLVLIAGSLIVVLSFESRFAEIQKNTFLWGLMLVPLIALVNLRSASIRGLHMTVLGQLPDLIMQPAIFISLIIIVTTLFSRNWFDAPHAIFLHVISVLLVLIISSYMLARIRPKEIFEVKAIYKTREWITSAIPLAMIAGIQLVHKNTDVLILGFFLGAEDVGIYRIATQGAMIASFGISAVTIVIAPHLASLYSIGNLDKMQKILTTSARLSLVLALLITLSAIFFGKWAIALVFGKEFLGAYIPLLILCVGQVITLVLGSSVTLASMTGHENECAKVLIQGAIINILMNLVLIPPLGMTGAALATVISLFIWRTILYLRLKKLIGLDTTIFSRK